MAPIASLLLPLAVDLIRSYIRSSDSSKDDKVLNVVQEGCRYLAPKDSNSLDDQTAKKIDQVSFWG